MNVYDRSNKHTSIIHSCLFVDPFVYAYMHTYIDRRDVLMLFCSYDPLIYTSVTTTFRRFSGIVAVANSFFCVITTAMVTLIGRIQCIF